MKTLLENWRLRMLNYKEEADNATSHIVKIKAMAKFLTLRDCIKEVNEQLSKPSGEKEYHCWEELKGKGYCISQCIGCDYYVQNNKGN